MIYLQNELVRAKRLRGGGVPATLRVRDDEVHTCIANEVKRECSAKRD